MSVGQEAGLAQSLAECLLVEQSGQEVDARLLSQAALEFEDTSPDAKPSQQFSIGDRLGQEVDDAVL